MFLRPPPVHDNEGDYKEARLKTFCDRFMKDYDVIAFQEIFSCLNSRKEKIIKSARE